MFKSIKKRLSSNQKRGDAPDGAAPRQPAPAQAGGAGAGAVPPPSSSPPPPGAGDKKAGGAAGGKAEKKRSSRKERSMSGRASGPRMLAMTDLLPDLQEPTRADLLKPQQSFQSVPAEERPMLFVRKLRLCSVIFHFEAVDETQPPQSPQPQDREEQRAKEVKRQLLLELVDYLQKYRSFITEPILIEMLRMVSINLFRPLPMKPRDAFLDPDEEEPMYDPQWPHLQIAYEFFLRFIVASDVEVRMLKKHINGAFVLNVLELFDSEDPRERDYLKTILHRIYAKFMSLRAFIRKAINNVFYTFIYDTQRHAGTAELLEILGSIINGFALPLKDEHKLFLRRVLLPMHKVRPLPHFHQQLSYCVTQFVNKDVELAVPVLKGLLKLWPVTNSSKEVLFIGELEEVVELTQTEQFREVMVPLFKQVARSIGSPHFQVAERALFLWHNEYLSSLIADHKDVILPVIFPVLSRNSQSHWNPTVMNLTVNVLKIFMEMDSVLVQECSKRLEEEQRRREVEKTRRALTWQRLEEAGDAAGQTEAA